MKPLHISTQRGTCRYKWQTPFRFYSTVFFKKIFFKRILPFRTYHSKQAMCCPESMASTLLMSKAVCEQIRKLFGGLQRRNWTVSILVWVSTWGQEPWPHSLGSSANRPTVVCICLFSLPLTWQKLGAQPCEWRTKKINEMLTWKGALRQGMFLGGLHILHMSLACFLS